MHEEQQTHELEIRLVGIDCVAPKIVSTVHFLGIPMRNLSKK